MGGGGGGGHVPPGAAPLDRIRHWGEGGGPIALGQIRAGGWGGGGGALRWVKYERGSGGVYIGYI